jgi:hypothetical protein
VHAERLVHKLIPFNDRQRLAIDLVRQLIWWFYADLKAYRDDPCRKRRTQLRARFERIFKRRTGFVTLDRLLARLHARKNELLLLLDRPEIPLHSNGSENDIRCHRHQAQGLRRHLERGRPRRPRRRSRPDETCHKQALTFFDYLGSRLNALPCSAPAPPPRPPDFVRRFTRALAVVSRNVVQVNEHLSCHVGNFN